ncbi:ABC transporter ATP-binding protein [Pseudarthrobacter sp. P1]|uniref:ABC transporter ATP-binding protein n=1 Tax=Pseudarthrobacter sp. P1 TaxID=3418418 RepID=UPI003CF20213
MTTAPAPTAVPVHTASAAASFPNGNGPDHARPAAVELRNVSVRYQKTTALADFSLRVERGETVALLGPSGSGKSTALKAIAGFEQTCAGTVLLDGKDVGGISPAQRGLGVVVQSYALFPHMRVDANVAYGLKARRMPRAQIAERVAQMLAMVGMSAHAHKYPRQLSGGQQQRIAIARALAIKPSVLLLDEPLSALDAQLRAEMLLELAALRAELPEIAMVYVTHDQSEALTLADRIAVMRNSRLEEIGTADQLYNRPASSFTASFLGGAALLPAVVQTPPSESGSLVTVAAGPHMLRAVAHHAAGLGEVVNVAVRPHAWRVGPGQPLSDGGPDSTLLGTNTLPARVDSVQWRGAGSRLQADLLGTGQRVTVDIPPLAHVPIPGDLVVLSVDPHNAVLVPAEGAA